MQVAYYRISLKFVNNENSLTTAKALVRCNKGFCLECWMELVIKKVAQVSLSKDRNRLPTPVFMGFPGVSDCKEFACNVGDMGLIPGLGRSPGGGNGNIL